MAVAGDSNIIYRIHNSGWGWDSWEPTHVDIIVGGVHGGIDKRCNVIGKM